MMTDFQAEKFLEALNRIAEALENLGNVVPDAIDGVNLTILNDPRHD